MTKSIERQYPTLFRQEDAQNLAQHLLDHSSVVLVGMKRVGISNFLRFFLGNTAISQKYFQKSSMLFFVVDAHDLIECAIAPFWTLVLKRMTDTVDESDLSDEIKKTAREFFLQSIQLKDTFYTYDCVQKLCAMVAKSGQYPVLVFTRFDRLLPAFSQDFFANLQGLKDAAGKLSYIFTSFRPLEQLKPEIFTPSSMSVFAHTQYLKPASEIDAKIVLETLMDRYGISLDKQQQLSLINTAAGHVQYLHLGLLAYRDAADKDVFSFSTEHLQENESISLQSEELFEELTEREKVLCISALSMKKLNAEALKDADYLKQSGMFTDSNQLFSALFASYIEKHTAQKNGKQKELSRQEQTLYELFQEHLGSLVERNDIVETVWPDQAEDGVSDWAIDRLVARLRQKLKNRSEPFKIVTVVTRGYKLERES